jgi:hypothetical protein
MVAFVAAEEAVQLVDGSGTTVQSLEAAPDLSSGLSLVWSESAQGWLVTGMTLG